jgi:Concanavalin A-like lectin/glucanases superfamily
MRKRYKLSRLLLLWALTLSGTALAFPIEIDATALSTSKVQVGSVAFSPQSPQYLELPSGLHSLQYWTGSWASITFTVTPGGTLEYDPKFDPVLSGRGTTRLLVHGASVRVDATALSTASFVLGGLAGNHPTSVELAATLLPGIHPVQYWTGSWASITFTVTPDGTIEYDPKFDPILSGRGTTRLLVRGAAVRVDAAALSAPSFVLGGLAGNHPTSVELAATLLPGIHPVQYWTGAGWAMSTFTITPGGTIDYDVSLDLIFAGRGSTRLIVLGARVEIDARMLGASSFSLPPMGPYSTAAIQSLALLPGPHYFSSTPRAFTFSIRPTVTFDYDASLDNTVTGRGTHRLTFLGACAQNVTWTDLSGKGHHGTLKNFSSTPASGWIGTGTPTDPYALRFDGQDDFVELAPSADGLRFTDELTLEVWAYNDASPASYSQIFSNRDGTWEYSGIGLQPFWTYYYTTTGWSWTSQNTPATVGTWNHVVVTYSRSNGRASIYVNGVEQSLGFVSQPLVYGANALPRIGADKDGAFPYPGRIALLRMWSSALTQAQIDELYSTNASRFGLTAPSAPGVQLPAPEAHFEAGPCGP